MRSLFGKIFFTFWLATILIILTIAWITSEITKKSSLLTREQLFMDNHAHAAIVMYESGKHQAVLTWLDRIGRSHHMTLYLLTGNGQIIGNEPPTNELFRIAKNISERNIQDALLRTDNIILSHDIVSPKGLTYRLAAMSKSPLASFITIPWAGLAIRLLIAIFISGFICYLLSIYLTQPLRSLQQAAKSLATGNLDTRVGRVAGHYNDEIAALSSEFDGMAEQLETLIKSKERLLQDISHELRSPLARLQLAIELGRKKTSHLADSEFDRMELECARLNALISEILEFARLEHQTNATKKSDCHLDELIQKVIQNANYEFSNLNRKAITTSLEPCVLPIDKRLMSRALENIIRNALRYSPAHKTVHVSLYKNLLTNNIHIDIIDEGPGIPEEQLTSIFHPFYRVDTSREKATGGIGLGLAIAKQAIDLHQGRIEAINRKTGGLLVRILLPS